jgi:hypothetical protein
MLPDLTQTAAPVPRAAGGVAAYSPKQNQVGQIMRASAGDLADAANIVAATNDRQDAIVAQAAANNLQAARTEAEFDPQAGFRSRKEGQAVGKVFVEDYTQRFKDAQDSIRAGLESDSQRRIFDQHAAVQGLQYRAALLQHQAGETEKFNDTTADASLKLALRSMAQRPDDELNFQTSLAQINGTIDQNGVRKGLPAEVIAELKGTYLDAAYSARITSIMQGLPGISTPDPIKAAAMFKQVEDKLGPATINKLGGELTQAIKLNTMSQIAQSEGAVLAERFDYTRTGDALKVIDGLNYPPEQKAAIRAEVEHRHAVMQSDADKANAQVVGKLHEMVYSDMPLSKIMATPEYQQARDKGAILEMARNKTYQDTLRANANDERGLRALQRAQAEMHITQAGAALAYSDPTVLAATPREKIWAQLPKLGMQWTQELLAKKDALEKGGANGQREAAMDHDDIKAVAKDFFGIDPSNLKTPEQKAAFMEFTSRAERLIAADPAGRQMSREEKYKKLAAEASRTVTTDPAWYKPNKQTPLLLLDPKTAQQVVVPKDETFKITEALRAARARPGMASNPDYAETPENVRRLYLLKKQREAAQ